LLKAVKHTKEPFVELCLKRYHSVLVCVKKNGPFGAELDPTTKGKVTKIVSGVLKNHNRSAKPGLEIVPGDTLKSVNGKTGTVREVMQFYADLPDDSDLFLNFSRDELNVP